MLLWLPWPAEVEKALAVADDPFATAWPAEGGPPMRVGPGAPLPQHSAAEDRASGRRRMKSRRFPRLSGLEANARGGLWDGGGVDWLTVDNYYGSGYASGRLTVRTSDRL